MAASFAVPAPCLLFTTSAFGALQLITTWKLAATRSVPGVPPLWPPQRSVLDGGAIRILGEDRSVCGIHVQRRLPVATSPPRACPPVRSRLGPRQSGALRRSTVGPQARELSLLPPPPSPSPVPLLLSWNSTAFLPSSLQMSPLLLSPPPFPTPAPTVLGVPPPLSSPFILPHLLAMMPPTDMTSLRSTCPPWT